MSTCLGDFISMSLLDVKRTEHRNSSECDKNGGTSKRYRWFLRVLLFCVVISVSLCKILPELLRNMSQHDPATPGPYHVEYPHDYHFLIDEPDKCRERKPFLVLMVPVAPSNRAARDAIRRTWGAAGGVVRGKAVSLLFLLGLGGDDGAGGRLQEQVLQESREHRDLLQSDFRDSYKNLTIKTMVMLEWLTSRCPDASYAMKVDSDAFLNVDSLVGLLLTAPRQRYMTGHVAESAPVLRDPDSKWYLPSAVFPDSVYPPYALGLGYVMSLDLPRKLLEASRHVKALYIEDVYLGLCMKHLGIQPTDPRGDIPFYTTLPPNWNACFLRSVVVIIMRSPQEILDTWRLAQRPDLVC